MIKIDTSGMDDLIKKLDNAQKHISFTMGEMLIDTLGHHVFNEFELKCNTNNIEFESDEFISELDNVVKVNTNYANWEELRSDYMFKRLGLK
ncbi:hypothetical protein FJQ98_15930 [Lysinibacillus agricola]|uniref:IDEAL domain-containing protein n=1 Tax=Lysinibacillus agricola TaxID=2590012 RepID=A0ABX7ALN8_9BACI|nr:MULTISPECIES: hypothetical protein [Lysinibacillus]KOS61564.1 hypothetical protein AN161_18430 [Lysinibacillus sp. FJAT-14222]QQP10734.1 hypothetical protein FJQ98_15930 [Lysinibacillus agricola]